MGIDCIGRLPVNIERTSIIDILCGTLEEVCMVIYSCITTLLSFPGDCGISHRAWCLHPSPSTHCSDQCTAFRGHLTRGHEERTDGENSEGKEGGRQGEEGREREAERERLR